MELPARIMILYFFCTGYPNPALVSRAEQNLNELTEHDREGQYNIY